MRPGSDWLSPGLLGGMIIILASGMPEGHTIAGRIIDETGQGVGGVVISGNNRAGTAIRADGTCSARTPGRWTGVVTPEHGAIAFASASQRSASQPVPDSAGSKHRQSIVKWPKALVAMVRHTKEWMAFFSSHSLLGVPADWPLRFLVLGGLYLVLQLRLRRRYALAITVLLFLGTELFELFAIRDPLHPLSPDSGDIADILAGMSGIAGAEILARTCIHKTKR